LGLSHIFRFTTSVGAGAIEGGDVVGASSRYLSDYILYKKCGTLRGPAPQQCHEFKFPAINNYKSAILSRVGTKVFTSVFTKSSFSFREKFVTRDIFANVFAKKIF
jgi:hypothetical protein